MTHDGTGSVWGGTGWFFVILGQYWGGAGWYLVVLGQFMVVLVNLTERLE